MKLFTFISIFLIVSCDSFRNSVTLPNVDLVEELAWLEEANPIKDVEAAINLSDYRFAGVYGEALLIPSIECKNLDIEEEVKIIDWSTDVIFNDDHMRLKKLAHDYAAIFNKNMLNYLVVSNGYICKT